MPQRRGGGVTRQNVLVIGLGRFGQAVAETLMELGHEVMGVDEDPEIVAELAPQFTTVVEANAASEQAMRQLGAGDFARALVAIGDVEASVLASSNLIELGVQEVWAKALSDRHGRILERLGVHHVVSPEREQGHRVGHLISGAMLDFIEVEGGWALAKVLPTPQMVGHSLADNRIRERFAVTVVGTQKPGQPFQFAQRDTIIQADDALIIAGQNEDCERFSDEADADRQGR